MNIEHIFRMTVSQPHLIGFFFQQDFSTSAIKRGSGVRTPDQELGQRQIAPKISYGSFS